MDAQVHASNESKPLLPICHGRDPPAYPKRKIASIHVVLLRLLGTVDPIMLMNNLHEHGLIRH